MANPGAQKRKTLILYRFLLEQTDAAHPATVAQMMAELSRHGITAERKSIYADLALLRDFGLDIVCHKGSAPGWFVASRDFELAELKLLVDAVQASRFITRRKSAALIAKLARLAGPHQALRLQRQVFVERRIKSMNESIYANVDKLHAAIAAGKRAAFQYFDYDLHKQKALRRQGRRYLISPHALVWANETYYLVGREGADPETRHYRVDKMQGLTVTGMDALPPPEAFDLPAYTARHFGMFHGRDATVTLRVRNPLAGVVLDRFGQGVTLTPDGAEHFTVSVPVAVSPQFFGWLVGLGGDAVLTAPRWATDAFCAHLSEIRDAYAQSAHTAGQ